MLYYVEAAAKCLVGFFGEAVCRYSVAVPVMYILFGKDWRPTGTLADGRHLWIR